MIECFAEYDLYKQSTQANRLFQYFMVGSMGLMAAAGAKATVQGMAMTNREQKMRRDMPRQSKHNRIIWLTKHPASQTS